MRWRLLAWRQVFSTSGTPMNLHETFKDFICYNFLTKRFKFRSQFLFSLDVSFAKFFSQTFLKNLFFVLSFLLLFISFWSPLSQTCLCWYTCVKVSSVSCHITVCENGVRNNWCTCWTLIQFTSDSFSTVSCHIPSVVTLCGTSGWHICIKFFVCFLPYPKWWSTVSDSWLVLVFLLFLVIS
jgi:hypothetical protein